MNLSKEKMLLKLVNPFALFLGKLLCPTIRANIGFLRLKYDYFDMRNRSRPGILRKLETSFVE